ncbi:2Fe-2S iron-sulfur cluster-binding protein [Plesiomonas sp.]|uniref:2Fe-2S iron-sulfur cluster-binding protein n=1 Tax=Plesiomonas sp. TaxID=2486279 RepID=UPI003F3383E7
MTTVTYIEYSGNEISVELLEGESIMEGALRGNVTGIDADCGGSCSCATCHVYVDDLWVNKLPLASAMEKDILSFANGVTDNSRLSCQLKPTPDLNGLIVRIPESRF